MEQIIKYLIYCHAFLGGIGLLSGMFSISVKKGSDPHKKAGKAFSFSMVGSALISLFVAQMPNHENLFLFLIGVFTIYMVLSGNRALTFKSKLKEKANFTDKAISGIMVGLSAIMILVGVYGLVQQLPNSTLFIFFGGFGLFLALGDFKTFRTFKENRKAWLTSHIGRMVGALIASVTAFIVAGLHFTSIFFWIAPTILGTAYIIFWSRKVTKQGLKAVNS